MKSQAALEYLMTYGLAILIAIIIGITLYTSGVFNPTINKEYRGLTKFTVLDWKTTNGIPNDFVEDSFLISVSPNGNPISDVSATATYKSKILNCTAPKVMNPSKKYTIVCKSTDSNIWNTGDPYTNLQLNINYVNTVTGLSHTVMGTFSGKVDPPDWRYKQRIIIKNPNSENLTDYQVLINLNTRNLISSRKMNSDCSDIRFASSNGTELDYYIYTNETEYPSLSYSWDHRCNSPDTFVLVKVPSLPANSNTTIYMYYGNPNAKSKSSLLSVFSDNIGVMNATLSSGRDLLSCIPYGDNIYCFGGIDSNRNYVKQIVKYDIVNDKVNVMNAELPNGRLGLSCAPYGNSIYCFGGYNGSEIKQIVKYDIVNDKVNVMNAELPNGRHGLSCVPYGDNIYCFGGIDSNRNYVKQIVKYDIVNDKVNVMNAELPWGRYGLSCAPYGDSIYCFGGGNGSYLKQIVKYNIVNDKVEVMNAKLPNGRDVLSCAPYGDSIYCFGGYNGSRIKQIVKYNVKEDKIFVMNSTLPSGRLGISCAPYGDSIYCFGGYDNNEYLNQIIRYAKKHASSEPTITLGSVRVLT